MNISFTIFCLCSIFPLAVTFHPVGKTPLRSRSMHQCIDRDRLFNSRRVDPFNVVPRLSASTSNKKTFPKRRLQARLGRTILFVENRDQLVSSSSSSSSDGKLELQKGLAVLLTVPFAWGTFEVAVRYAYAQSSVPAFLFSLAYYAVASTALLFATILFESFRTDNDDDKNNNKKKETISNPVMESTSNDDTMRKNIKNSQANLLQSSPTSSSWPIFGGLELGFYLFAGNMLQVLGLKTVASDRAAFLLQLTTVFVPVFQSIFSFVSSNNNNNKGGKDDKEGNLLSIFSVVSGRVWLACGIALLGVGIIGLDNPEKGATGALSIESMDLQSLVSAAQFSSGDLLIVGAALTYTFHCLRLEPYAKSSSVVKLAACKAVSETVLSAIALTVVIAFAASTDANADSLNTLTSFLVESGRESTNFLSLISNEASSLSSVESSSSANYANMWMSSLISTVGWPAIFATIWTGLIPVAYTIYACSYGQRRVRPVTANLIYTIQPICTTLAAFVVLNETLGLPGYIGGVFIGTAVLLVVAEPSDGASVG